MTTDTYAQQQQRARDLRTQLSDLGTASEQAEILFQEWSPGRKMQKLWSMQDGVEITIPSYMVGGALMKRLPDGRYAFTANKAEAPEFVDGDVPCFLAAGSPERESGILAEAGLDHLPACPAEHLRSLYSKDVHGTNRHRQSYAALQDFLARKEREEDREERRSELAAIRDLAGAKAPAQFVCDECGREFKNAFGLRGHLRSHEKET